MSFAYWEYFEFIEIEKGINLFGDIIKEMSPNPDYVEKRYKDFKTEILHYHLLSVHQFETEIKPKVYTYLKSNIVKSIGESAWGLQEYFSIPPKVPIGFDNLVSIALYTDYTNLSSDFTSTFRRKWQFESIEQVKRRNGRYWWWSKALRETLLVYGERGKFGDLKGPFYTGMSRVMNLPQFNIRLNSPTSTSVQMAVAMRFSGHTGMILQFENENGRAKHTHGFDCSWLSRFKEEDERYTI